MSLHFPSILVAWSVVGTVVKYEGKSSEAGLESAGERASDAPKWCFLH